MAKSKPKAKSKTNVKTYKHRIGKNLYIVINISQSANAKTELGNALASNAVNVAVFKKQKEEAKAKKK
ncbi:hypothetical protein ACFQ88_27440 [Paenibacillus sp. NPDC056579]|uniref:hypothetical protein n=1 Tax=unclassified Paenibacillus TaxID=185978 RepID=UPI001EF759A9|nr:hypothetical protein [Paenibacillus sp. H1-7]ULL13128.1 hypothetical protein DVH26_00710 [Paenibacillus sp. H1-7]